MIIDDVKEGPVQSHNPDERVWEYDDDGQKIYKVNHLQMFWGLKSETLNGKLAQVPQ